MADSMKNSVWRKWPYCLSAFWRDRVRRQWHTYRWFVIGGVWIVALGLGYVGFARYFAALGEARSPSDLLYLTLQLFTLESGSVSGPKGWELELARLLAPAIAAYTAVQALAVILFEQFQSLRLLFIQGHVVICGLGRKGHLLAQAFRERGDRVVVIEQDEDNSFLKPCRDLGAVVLIGDATERETLRRAGVQRARYLVATGGDDGVNAEIAVHARELVGGRDGIPLTCLVHIVDPHLCDLLRERELEAESPSSYRLSFFNTFDLGARAVLDEYPPFGETDQVRGSPPHLLLVGLGSVGRSLVVHAARRWRERHRRERFAANHQDVTLSGSEGQSPGQSQQSGEARLRITVVDREADHKTETLLLRYPQLPQVCELIPAEMDIRWPEFHRARFLYDPDGRCTVTAIYVCLDNEPLGLAAGLTLLQRLRGQEIPIVVRMASEAGLATLLDRAEEDGGGFANLHAFALLDRTCQPDLLLGGTHEILARAIHEDYVRHQAEVGETPQTNRSMVAWDELPESLKESNRRQADHIGVKLKAVGCGIAPLTAWDAESFQFTPEEVELMARMEHERFVEERLRAGWRPGPKDPARKTSPHLVPWKQLSEEIKELDRNPVRGLPRFLARAGLQIYRWFR